MIPKKFKKLFKMCLEKNYSVNTTSQITAIMIQMDYPENLIDKSLSEMEYKEEFQILQEILHEYKKTLTKLN